MRFFSILFIIAFLAACSGTQKTISENRESTISEKETADSILAGKPEKIYIARDSLAIALEEKEVSSVIQKGTLKPEIEFHQILSKRELGAHELWNELLQKYVSEDGFVNYEGLKTEKQDFYGYIHVLNLIYQHAEFDSLAKEEKLAFWINTYNAFTIDLVLRNYPLKSIKELKNPWKQRHWKLGDKWFNLDDIEHQILRKMNEPRIHFAINCASISCPKLQNNAFTAEKLEAQLSQATKEFLSDPSKNYISENNLKLSKLFQWFAKDFKQNGSLIDFLNANSEIQINKDAKRSFMDYNWNINE